MKLLTFLLLSLPMWLGTSPTAVDAVPAPTVPLPVVEVIENRSPAGVDAAEDAAMCCQSTEPSLLYTANSVSIVFDAMGAEANPNTSVKPYMEFYVWVNNSVIWNGITSNQACGENGSESFPLSRELFGNCPDYVRLQIKFFGVNDDGSYYSCNVANYILEERKIFDHPDKACPANPHGDGPGF